MYQKFVYFIFFFAIIFPVHASAAEKMYTREQCLEMAITRNPLVLTSIEKRTQAEWGKKSAYDDFLPKLNVGASSSYRDGDYDAYDGFINIRENRSNYEAGIYIEQPLFTGFRLTETYNLADIGLKVAVAGEQLANLEIIFQTLWAYYNFLMDQKLERVAISAVTQLTSHLKDSEQFYKNEIIPLNDLLESKVHLANARQDARVAASRTRTSRMALANIIKEPLMSQFNIQDTPDMDALTSKVETITLQALETRPELQQANYNLEASKKQITIAKSAYFPTVSLSAGQNYFGGDSFIDEPNFSDTRDSSETIIGIYASWEIFAWGQTKHEVNRAAAATREAEHSLKGVMDEVKLEVQDNFIYAITAYENIETAKIAVEQARENLRMNEIRYKNQLATNTNVLDARTLLTDTETKYYQAVYDYNIKLAGLARAVGVASWKDLIAN